MNTQEIIAALKSKGLDPDSVNMEHMGDDEVQDLIAALGVATNDGDAQAQAYYERLMTAINKLDS